MHKIILMSEVWVLKCIYYKHIFAILFGSVRAGATQEILLNK